MINLFERAALQLGCSDFGIKVAKQTRDPLSTLGPLEVAMKNANTIGEAMSYCAKYIHVYSQAVHLSLERDEWTKRDYLLFDFLLEGVPRQRQAVEHAIGLTYNAVKALSGNRVRPVEVWFSHNALSSPGAYASLFETPIKFNMPNNALFFAPGDINKPVAEGNSQIFKMADSYIDKNFPGAAFQLTKEVRVLINKMLVAVGCDQTQVADTLGMHPRTLQRRLRSDGTTFEQIVDSVRREITLRALADEKTSLTQIAEKLGYSETSVLTRSCQRWFSSTPRKIRRELQSNTFTTVSQ